jgi:hypothetical protein
VIEYLFVLLPVILVAWSFYFNPATAVVAGLASQGVLALILNSRLNRLWRNSSQFRETQISEDGLWARTSETEVRVPWSAYKRVYEDKHGYRLTKRESRSYVFIPRRAFASESDENRFRELVRSHVTDSRT